MNTPRIGNIYMLVVLFMQLLLSALYLLIKDMIPSTPTANVITTICSQIFCFVIPFVIYLLLTRQKISDVLSFKKINGTNIMLIVFMCFAIQPTMSLLSGLSMIAFENNMSSFMTEIMGLPIPLIILAVAITPSIFEEITMRGVILKNYEGRSIKKAALANGLFFGILHLDPQQFLYAFFMGAIFCYFVYYTQSILASMLAHFTINASQCLTAIFAYKSLDNMPEEARKLIETPTTAELINTGIFLVILTAMFLPVFVILFSSFIKYNKQRIFKESLNESLQENELSDENLKIQNLKPPIKKTKAPSLKITNWAFWCVIAFYLVFMILKLF